jgi:Zn-dependent protease
VLNVLMALGFMAAALFVPVMAVGAMINLQLAFFNLIPFPPLDGSKIVRWNPALWGGLVAAAIGLQFFIPGG